MSQNAIEISALRKTYTAQRNQPAREALQGVDLAISAGSIFGLLGPNGAGKSTMINILAGLVLKTSGQVRIWGFDQDVNPRQSRAAIGVMPQELNLDPFLTPRGSLEVQAGLYGIPGSQRYSDEILDMIGLTDKADAYARSLSGGMRRRLLLGKALVHRPQVLVLDEPTAGVDIELRQMLWSNVRKLNDQGMTIILTTHYLEEAEELCDEIAIISHGEVLAQEPTPQLLARLDQRLLKITPKEPLSSVPNSLADLNAKLSEDGDLNITFHSSETGIGRLLEQVREAGIGVADLSTEQPNLEDVFVAMTTETA